MRQSRLLRRLDCLNTRYPSYVEHSKHLSHLHPTPSLAPGFISSRPLAPSQKNYTNAVPYSHHGTPAPQARLHTDHRRSSGGPAMHSHQHPLPHPFPFFYLTYVVLDHSIRRTARTQVVRVRVRVLGQDAAAGGCDFKRCRCRSGSCSWWVLEKGRRGMGSGRERALRGDGACGVCCRCE